MKTIAKSLFEHYQQNLNAFRAHPRVRVPQELERDDIVVCPICLKYWYTLNAINTKQLTVEHAPPHGLQGEKVALTCQSCNNIAGSQLDSFLIAYIRELDARSPSSENTSVHQPKPTKKHEFTLTLTNTRHKKAHYSLLRSAYVLAFAQLGYGYLWNPNLDKVRLQFQQPQEELFPVQAVQMVDVQHIPDRFLGINIISHPAKAKCFYVVFDVALKHAAPHRVGVMLPGPNPHDFDWFDHLKHASHEHLKLKLAHCDIAPDDKLKDPLLAYKLMDDFSG